MLAIYTGGGVVPEVNLRERISRTPPQSSNKAEPTQNFKKVDPKRARNNQKEILNIVVGL